MKIAFSFLLLSASVLLSQQQQHFGHLPWSQFLQRPSIRDVYDYLYARSFLDAVRQPSNLEQQESAKGHQWSDIQARTKNTGPEIASSISENGPSARIFFNYVTTAGSTSSYFNPLLKTIYYITTSTATTTSVKTCVPAASFSATQYTVACRKRREVMGMLMGMNADDDVPSLSPSSPVSVETTVAARSLRSMDSDAIAFPVEISSSKTDEYLVEKGIFSDIEQAREKRFLLASSTITTYVFVTTSTTKTLSNIGSSLSCLPSQFALC